jgi:predicted double-glycine peptidase
MRRDTRKDVIARQPFGPLLPLPDNLVQVPVVRQRRDFSCGAAAVLALLRYWSLEAYSTLEEDALYAPLKTSDSEGTEPEPMAELLERNGISTRYRHGDVTTGDLELAVDARQPPIIDIQAWRDQDTPWRDTWDAGHYVIMVGYDARWLFFADPSTLTQEGYAYMPRGELEERWHDLAGGDNRRLHRMALFAEGSCPWHPSSPGPREASRLG